LWDIKSSEENVEDVFSDRLEDIVYLSPNAEEPLLEVDPGKVNASCEVEETRISMHLGQVYVIGGLVDVKRIRYKSLNRSSNMGRCLFLADC